MGFNLTKYFRNQYLIEDVDKNVWMDLKGQELDDFADEIFGLINNAYGPIGGHPNYNSPDNVVGSESDAIYSVIDLDDDPDIDAVNVYKLKPSGKKSVAMGHDGTSPAKRAAINIKAILLKKPGYYIEVSGKIKDILMSKGVPIVTDEGTIRRALKGKDIKIFDDGTYSRKIGGNEYRKTMMGNPL